MSGNDQTAFQHKNLILSAKHSGRQYHDWRLQISTRKFFYQRMGKAEEEKIRGSHTLAHKSTQYSLNGMNIKCLANKMLSLH